MTELLYHSLTGKLIESLIQQLLFFGVFAVSLTNSRRAILDKGWISSIDCVRHLLISASLALFTLYIGLTYEIENFKGIQERATDFSEIQSVKAILSFSPAEMANAKAQLLVMLPLDLIGIIINSFLFGVLVWFAVEESGWNGRNISTIKCVIHMLKLLCLWHLCSILWWIAYGLFGEGIEGIISHRSDIFFHVTYIVIDFLAARVFAGLLRSEAGRKKSSLVANLATALLVGIFVSLYAIRLWDYSDRFIEILR